MAVPWSGDCHQGSGFDPSIDHVGFLVDKMWIVS